jgi:hypothetical protein
LHPKYASGQQVIIVSVKDKNHCPKYPEIENYVGDLAIVVDCYWVGFEELDLPREYFIYRVYISRTNTEISVQEEAIKKAF